MGIKVQGKPHITRDRHAWVVIYQPNFIDEVPGYREKAEAAFGFVEHMGKKLFA